MIDNFWCLFSASILTFLLMLFLLYFFTQAELIANWEARMNCERKYHDLTLESLHASGISMKLLSYFVKDQSEWYQIPETVLINRPHLKSTCGQSPQKFRAWKTEQAGTK